MALKQFLPNKIDETIFLSPITEQEISKEIGELKPNKSSGSDGISARLIREWAPCIIKPLKTYSMIPWKQQNANMRWKLRMT